MVATAQKRSLPEVLRAVVSGLAQWKKVAQARIWLIDKGDIMRDLSLPSGMPPIKLAACIWSQAREIPTTPGTITRDWTTSSGDFQ